MSRKKSHNWYLKSDIIMVGVGVLLFIIGVAMPFPDPVKIAFIVAGVGFLALAGANVL